MSADSTADLDLPEMLRRCLCADIKVSFVKPTDRGTHLGVRCEWETYTWTRSFTINSDSTTAISRALDGVLAKTRQIESVRMASVDGWQRDYTSNTTAH